MTSVGAAALPLSVAIVGGGRWARTIAGVLSSLRDENTTIVLCSPGHPERWRIWLDARPLEEQSMFVIETSLEQILHSKSIGSVFVVRAARDNAATAIDALSAGKVTFVEKPFALNRVDAERVIAAAAKVRCMVGHVLLFSSSIGNFVAEARALGVVQRIGVEWHDAKAEFRHGEVKSYDHSINVVQDVFPHIWSLIRLLIPHSELRMRGVESLFGGRCARLTLSAGNVEIIASMQRDARARRRILQVTAEGKEAKIDFSIEPGSAYIGDRAIDVTTGFKSPLARELSYFLSPWCDPVAARFTNVENALELVALSEAAAHTIRLQQATTIQVAIRAGASTEQRQAAIFALREWIAGDRRTQDDSKRHDRNDEHAAQKALRWLADDRSWPVPNELKEANWINDLRLQ